MKLKDYMARWRNRAYVAQRAVRKAADALKLNENEKALLILSEALRFEHGEPETEGCLCQRCGRRYRVDFNVPDDVWDLIRHRSNLLCGPCIAERIEGLGKFNSYYVASAVEVQHGNEF